MQINEVKSLLDIVNSLSKTPVAAWVVRKFVIRFLPQDHPWWVSIRFLELFGNHGVARNEIPRFFKHGLQMKDTQNFLKLVSKLDEVRLQAATEMFGIRREWLDGSDKQIYPILDFYKQPESFKEFLAELGDSSDLYALVMVPLKPYSDRPPALLVLSEQVGVIGGRAIFRNYICEPDWIYNYWKSRAFLTACVAELYKLKISVIGRRVPEQDILSLNKLEEFISEGHHGYGMGFPNHGEHFYPDDWAITPDSFLQDLFDENDIDTVTEGLELWLRLAEQGYMDSGLGDPMVYIQAFNKHLIGHKHKKIAKS